jgi:hypothetical protein
VGLKRRYVLTVPPGGNGQVVLDQSLNFHVVSARVENYTDTWLRIEPDGLFVPPFTAGAVLDFFVEAAQVKVIAVKPPAGVNLAFSQQGGVAIFSVYDTPLYPFPGYGINPPNIPFNPTPITAGSAMGNIIDDLFVSGGTELMMGLVTALPAYLMNDGNSINESIADAVWARAMTAFKSAGVVLPTGGTDTDTTLGTQITRICRLIASTDQATRVIFKYSATGAPGGTEFYRGEFMPGIPHNIGWPQPGKFLSGSQLVASRITAQPTFSGVNLSLGIGYMAGGT